VSSLDQGTGITLISISCIILREERYWPKGEFGSIAFKFKTRAPGQYKFSVVFLGEEVKGVAGDLMIVVEDNPKTPMICVEKQHTRKNCAKGIEPVPT
jgi:hypothetical protein